MTIITLVDAGMCHVTSQPWPPVCSRSLIMDLSIILECSVLGLQWYQHTILESESTCWTVCSLPYILVNCLSKVKVTSKGRVCLSNPQKQLQWLIKGTSFCLLREAVQLTKCIVYQAFETTKGVLWMELISIVSFIQKFYCTLSHY